RRLQWVREALRRSLGNPTVPLAMMARVAHLQEAGKLAMPRAALGQATTARLARESAAAGRNIGGGNGILTDYDLSKMMSDAEIIYTYEGTYEINSLIVGRAMTGVSAFV